jgi:glycosyltransferase involved in cell wall biosynthesis
LVSVVIPTYNGSRFIRQAVESVLVQTLTDFELLVVDDASTDHTLSVARGVRDDRIRVLTSPFNRGAGANWNRGVHAARGRYVKLLCQDDLLAPECLERQVAALCDERGKRISLVCARRVIIDERGRVLGERGFRPRTDGVIGGAETTRLVCRSGGNPIGEPSAVLFRREDALRAGLFREDAEFVIDLDLWLRLLTLGALRVIDGPLAAFRVSSASWSVALARRQVEQYCELFRRVEQAGDLGLRRHDVLLGCLASRVITMCRRLLYAWLRLD